jgi:hypothetical protein
MAHCGWWPDRPNVVDVVDDDELVADDDDDLSGIIMLMFSTSCVLYGLSVMWARDAALLWCDAISGCVSRLVDVVDGASVALWCIICWLASTYWEWA